MAQTQMIRDGRTSESAIICDKKECKLRQKRCRSSIKNESGMVRLVEFEFEFECEGRSEESEDSSQRCLVPCRCLTGVKLVGQGGK